MTEGFLRLTRKWPEGAAVAALRDIDAVSHKKYRSAYRRINQRFLRKMLINSSAFSRNRKTDSLSVCGRFGQKEACNMDKVKEECGVFGILDPEGGNVAHSIYYGLTALQHRGQEACGIVTSDTSGPVGNYHCRKNAGLVSEVFHENSLESLPGNLGIGHVRYSTTGGSRPENAQPLAISYIKGTLALAHNGNLVNTADLKWELVRNGAVFHTTTDSEVIAFYLARERVHTQTIQEAVLSTARKLSGSYALVIMSPQKLIGLRDPYGLKPLCLGKRGHYILASESCALSAVDAEFIRDVEPGEMVTLSEKGIESDRSLQTGRCAHCIFEYIYFARLDSRLDGINVYDARIAAGKSLARSHPVAADLVTGVPESGLPGPQR